MWRLAILLTLWCGLAIYGLQHGSHAHSRGALTTDPNWTELNSSTQKMHQAMAAIESSGNDDNDFVRLMLPHHQAAIDMAKTQLMYGKDPQIRRLAQEIITDQQSEIELMQLWLRQHPPVSANPGRAPDPR